MQRFALQLLALVAFCLVVSAPLHAQQDAASAPDTGAAAAQPPAGGTAGGADPWGFEDEDDAEPTLAQEFKAQWVDIAIFSAYATLALVSFFKKSERLKIVTFIATIGYLGFYKSYVLSVVNLFALLVWNLPVFKYSLGWYTFAIFAVGTTIMFGRLYCGRLCAFGALTQLMDRVIPRRFRYEVPKHIERRANWIKFGMLAFVVVYYLATRDHFIFRYVEPFWMFGRQGSVLMWTMLAVLLTATIFVRNLYCRFLCPIGAFLGVVSQATMFRIPRWSECNTCRICEKTCEWGAIRGPKIVKSECVRCDDCERLYANEKKCPHWIIFYRKDEIAARKAARAAATAAATFTPNREAVR